MSNPKSFGLDQWIENDLTKLSSSLDDPLLADRRLGYPAMMRHGASNNNKKTRRKRPLTTPGSHRSASLEIPLRFEEGLSMEKKTSMTIYSQFPVAGSVRGGWGASTHTRGRTGYSTGKGDIYYSFAPWGSLRGGVVVGERHNVLLGGTLTNPAKKNSSLTATWQTRPLNWKQSMMSLSAKHSVHPWFALQSSVSVNPARKASFRINLQSKTMHAWSIGCGWSFLQRPFLSLQFAPQQSNKQRQIQLSAGVRRGVDNEKLNWSFGGTLTERSTSTKFSLGLMNGSLLQKGLVWVFSFTQGEFTLRVPIAVSTVTSPAQVAYLMVLSRILQDVVADVLHGYAPTGGTGQQQVQLTLGEKKRHDAMQQQRFMERQAKIRTEVEEKRNGGLVVRRAVYHVDGGDMWDVTIPLQFWVLDSSLYISDASKRHILGFYNVAESVAKKEENVSVPPRRTWSDWWAAFWTPSHTSKSSESLKAASPKLSVQYEMSGCTYEITIQDDEELILPNPKALVVKK